MWVQVTFTGEGTEQPETFKVTVTNILTQGSVGDLDFPRKGDGQQGIKWSFIECPTDDDDAKVVTSRRMLAA